MGIGNRKMKGSLGTPRAIKHEELSRRDLNLIFKLLQYYNKQVVTQQVGTARTGSQVDSNGTVYDDTPLGRYCENQGGKDRKPPKNTGVREENRIMFVIEDKLEPEHQRYELIFWNVVGKRDPNALTIINHNA